MTPQPPPMDSSRRMGNGFQMSISRNSRKPARRPPQPSSSPKRRHPLADHLVHHDDLRVLAVLRGGDDPRRGHPGEKRRHDEDPEHVGIGRQEVLPEDQEGHRRGGAHRSRGDGRVPEPEDGRSGVAGEADRARGAQARRHRCPPCGDPAPGSRRRPRCPRPAPPGSRTGCRPSGRDPSWRSARRRTGATGCPPRGLLSGMSGSGPFVSC